MRLTSENSSFKDGFLLFCCPNCRDDDMHTIRVAVSAASANTSLMKRVVEGEYPNFTLTPSVDVGCWHGNIVKGELIPCLIQGAISAI